MAINSKRKGSNGENQLVKILCERFGEGLFKRTPSSGAYVGGQNKELAKNLPWEAKITLVSDIITPSNFNFVIEHKFYKNIDFWELFSQNSKWIEWIDQVEKDAIFVKKHPMLIVKYNRHERLVIIEKEKISNYNLNVYIYWVNKKNNKIYAVLYLEELLKLQTDFWFDGAVNE